MATDEETFWDKLPESELGEESFAFPEEEFTTLPSQARRVEGEELPVEEVYDPALEEDPSAELVGLLYLGKLQKMVHWGGHYFSIRTLTMGEELEVAQLVREMEDTRDSGRAYATGIVAAALETVDGHVPVQPLGPDDRDLLARKYEEVKKWYWGTIRAVYDEYVNLAEQQFQAFDELKKD